MVKKIVFLFVVAIVLFLFFGCSNQSFSASDWLSDYRPIYFDMTCDEVYANFVSGVREDPYNYDGKHHDVVEFGIVSVWYEDASYSPSSLFFSLLVGEDEFLGTLEKSPFEECYMADIEKYVEWNEDIVLKIGDNIIYDLSCKSHNFTIDSLKAIEIGEGELYETLDEHFINGKLNGECYLKVIFDKSRKIKTYYWYFAFLDSSGKFSSCVIDTETGEVLAKV